MDICPSIKSICHQLCSSSGLGVEVGDEESEGVIVINSQGVTVGVEIVHKFVDGFTISLSSSFEPHYIPIGHYC